MVVEFRDIIKNYVEHAMLFHSTKYRSLRLHFSLICRTFKQDAIKIEKNGISAGMVNCPATSA